jgi:hypothetical protein
VLGGWCANNVECWAGRWALAGAREMMRGEGREKGKLKVLYRTNYTKAVRGR